MLYTNSSMHCWVAYIAYRTDPSLGMKLHLLPNFQIPTLHARYNESASYYTYVSQLQTRPSLYLAL